MSTPRIPHLHWPPVLDDLPDGTRVIREVEQDSAADIEGSALLLCSVRRNQLPWAPDTGITDPLGSTDPADAALLIEADLRRLEPRPARGTRVQLVPQPDGSRRIRLKVLT